MTEDRALDVLRCIGEHVRRTRLRRGWTLTKLSAAANVSRATIGQIEGGVGNPRIDIIGRVTEALGMRLAALLREPRPAARILRAGPAQIAVLGDGGVRRRSLTAQPRQVELHELELDVGMSARVPAAPSGTVEHLAIASGHIELEIAGATHHLAGGDSAIFDGDTPHAYRNIGATVAMAYVLTHRA